MSSFHNLTISAIEPQGSKAVCLSFEIPSDLQATFSFDAGQYVTLKATIDGNEVRRAYSICSVPVEGRLQVGIKKVDGGIFSTYANEVLKVGDKMEVMPPEGRFTLVAEDGKRQYAAFAAGSGITPMMSIIGAALAEEPESEFLLVYGNRNPNEAMFLSELEVLKNNYPGRLHIEYIYSRSRENNALFGRIQKSVVNYLLKNKYGAFDFDRFFLCGPGEMIDEVDATLRERGVDASAILFERFTSSTEEAPSVVQAEGKTQVKVIVDDESTELVMDREQSVLQAVLDAGIDAPYSCQGGICSSCIARITEGRAEMRKNQVLTDSEVEQGLVLTCQAHPTTPNLVVDYDDV